MNQSLTREPSPPRLTALATNRYHCDDLTALHRWLESHGYQYYGYFDSQEYGRFSHQEATDQGDARSYVHSFIQVLRTGEIYAPDPHATNLLDSLVMGDQERTV